MNTAPFWRLAVDIERCTGCHACSVACKAEYQIPLGHFRTKVYYRDIGQFPLVKRHFLPAFCMQCEAADCVSACPEKAIKRGADGIVRINQELCLGQKGKCGHPCVRACAYGALSAATDGLADKCDFCSDRLAASLQPSCVTACPTESLIFGNTNDPDSPISRFLNSPRGQSAMPVDRGGKPQVLYRAANAQAVARVPSGRPHDPRSYEIDQWVLEAKP